VSAPIGPGDFVECVHADAIRGVWAGQCWEPGAALTKGAIYTVREVFIDVAGREALDLVEVQRGPEAVKGWGGRIGYAPERFRPIYRPKSDLIESLKQPAPPVVRELLDA
jgi:hypothetical protein